MKGEQARMLAGRTDNIEAWDRVIRANEFFDRFTREDNLEARRLAEEALQIDPQYVGAWETLGWTHVTDAGYGWSESREQSTQLASEAARAACQMAAADRELPAAMRRKRITAAFSRLHSVYTGIGRKRGARVTN
jgi:hypothetical protein